jgi:prolyl 4-hydroxylase
MDSDVEAFVSNPLNAFMLIKRLSLDAIQIEHFVYNSVEEFSKGLEHLNLDPDELQGAVEGIDRLQTSYNLNTKDLANGIIDSDDFNITLSAYDLFVFGIELQKKEKYLRSIEYFVEALKKNQKHEDFKDVSDEEILTELILAYDITKNYEKAILAINDILQYNPENVEALLELKATFEELLKLGNIEKFEESGETLEQKLTRKVCSGEIKRSSTELSKLHCRYEFKNAFSLYFFKLEEINLDPLVVVYHEVVSESEIKILKALAKPELKRSVTIKTTGELDESKARVSKVAWFEDKDHKVVSRISKRIELMTGLTRSAAEDLQIQQYGIGGFYGCHFDFSEQLKLDDKGDRIATTLLYVSRK